MSTVLLYSGGVDSTTLLYHLVQHYGAAEVAALGFDYGQAHEWTEMRAARLLAAEVGVEFQRVHLPGQIFGPASGVLTLGDGDPVVPGRNLVLISVACAWAAARGADTVAIATHQDDHDLFPDCREDFLAQLSLAMEAAYGIVLYSPFVNDTKEEVVALARRLQVPLERTWSCYWSGAEHCNRCLACKERNRVLA